MLSGRSLPAQGHHGHALEDDNHCGHRRVEPGQVHQRAGMVPIDQMTRGLAGGQWLRLGARAGRSEVS